MLLVTGATGYLGASLVSLLVERGYRVRAAVRDPQRAGVLPGGAERVPVDLDDADSLRAAAAGCDGVFHVAASLGATPADTYRLNVEGTARVLDAARGAGVRRVVHTSTTAAIIDATGLVTESAVAGRTALTDDYSTTKAEAEAVALAADGIEVVVVSPVSIYGPSPRGPQSYNALLLAAVRGEVAQIVDATVGWVLADDVAAGHLLAYERGEPGARYVLCGEVATYSRMLTRFAELAGSGHRAEILAPGASLGPDATLFARRSEVYGKLAPVRIDDAGARALGFDPVGVDEGLRRTAEWLAEA